MTSGNRLSFSYTDSQNWNDKALDPKGICWVDLDAIEGAAETMKAYLDYSPYVGYSIGSKTFLPLIRLTGWFEGTEFHPVTLENTIYTTDGWPLTDLDQLNYLDLHNKLEWNTLVEAKAPADQTLVTIYGWNVDGIAGNHQTPVTVDGKTYDSLTDLRLALYYPTASIRGLWESISFSTVTLQDSYGTYTFALTVRSRPLQYALLRLMPAYLVFTAIVAVVTWLILRRIRRNLTAPLAQLSTAIQNNTPITPAAHWAELHTLEGQFVQLRQNLTDTQAENTRLNTALDYAKDAEAKRKELISNLAHELKTPLAVIQSYSEGLQAGIATEKQDQYIRTILDETGRMDHMVMQMLQLSRLESGKAKLNMENFSLNRLIQSVSSKFHPLMEHKNLNLRLELEDNAHMDGDIGRMEQVITNYLSNAVKYTCEGGQILIKATQGKHGIFFSITNTATHLSEEALNRVYDSFYRQNSSRTEKNSGLGLAIVKGIMTLHGYKCYVLNSKLDGQDAVEFGFFPNE
jgi:signal transduction histidine kinase